MAARLHRLGQTDYELSPIGQGVMQFAGGAGFFRAVFKALSQNEMNEIIKAAWTGGINWFDTAEVYGLGRSEAGLAQALQSNGIEEQAVLIATKWWPLLRTAGNIPRTISNRQRFLSPYSIGLYQVHQPFSFSSPEAEMDAMADLVEQGHVASVGVSNFGAVRMRRAHAALKNRGLTLASNQVKYSLLDRKIETNGILETAREFCITIIAWEPLESGLLSGKFHKDPGLLTNRPFYRRGRLRNKLDESRALVQELDEIAVAHGATAAQVALSWLINYYKDTVVAIPGASRPKHAGENAAAMALTLTGTEMTRLDELSRQFR